MFTFLLISSMKETMKISLSFKVDAKLKAALEKLAKQENRSLSNYVITTLMKHLEEKGIDWHQEED